MELVDGPGATAPSRRSASGYLEIAEHELGEVRRRAAVWARRFVGFEAIVAVTVPPARR